MSFLCVTFCASFLVTFCVTALSSLYSLSPQSTRHTGMDPGFNQAIELAGECLANVKLVQEKKLLQKYFDEISQDTGALKIHWWA